MIKDGTSPERGGPTFTQRGRRAQIVDVTIGLLADQGYDGISLAQIAHGAGVSKATVLYHFEDKAAVVRAAYEHVVTELVGAVGAAVDAVGAADRPAAYVRSMIAHLAEHPAHTRTSIEALTHATEERDTAARWRPLAELIAAARRDRGGGPAEDAAHDDRTGALIVGGAIDAVASEKLADPGYDATAAADRIVEILDRHLI
ncbi:TetR/AcrR family transcriptional regulator [Tsukamurella sp. 1534]|uniref:TetR/AcrR family transcriptional regulator n=1 Tax=Tsukamurella sp. 1534 TaxID=1151061 RepID=UPI000313F7EE|nr:TetR/AcrR family transcriptional regulator [Tsukamurella sp. 1534]